MIPVVTNQEDLRLIGVVTARDLALPVVADACDPACIHVESVMSRRPIVASPDDPYERVLEMMEQHQVRRVPVVDQTGRVVGIVSQADVALRVRDANKAAEVVREISRPAA